MKFKTCQALAFLSMLIIFSSCKINQYKGGLKTGLWVTKDSVGDQIYTSRGRFQYGHEKGTWRYFHDDSLVKKEKYHGNMANVWIYHPNKKIQAFGQTRIDFNSKSTHWYYSGEWKFFDNDGNLYRVKNYDKGVLKQDKLLKGR